MNEMNDVELKHIMEAALLAAGRPLSLDHLLGLFPEESAPARDEIRAALQALGDDYSDRGLEVNEVASGFRIQVRQRMEPWVSRLWEERPPKYSRALLETLALIAYRQPITRAEIEDIRGVSVSTSIMKTLQEREWVRVVGHRDVPGRPAMYATTRQFLDYFGLKSLDELPTLAELRDIDTINAELDFDGPAPVQASLPVSESSGAQEQAPEQDAVPEDAEGEAPAGAEPSRTGEAPAPVPEEAAHTGQPAGDESREAAAEASDEGETPVAAFPADADDAGAADDAPLQSRLQNRDDAGTHEGDGGDDAGEGGSADRDARTSGAGR